MAVGSWQHAVAQHAVSEGGDTAHAHARNDTPPRPPRPVDDCTDLGTRRTHPTGTPRPGPYSRTGSGSGSGSILDAGRPGPPHRQHPSHAALPLPLRCRCGRAGTPAPSAPAPATHPNPRHTGLRRCQPEPRPTRRPTRQHHRENTPPHRRRRLQPDPNQPGPGREPQQIAASSSLTGCSSTEDRPGPGQRPRPTTRLFVAAACSPTQKPAWSQPATSGDHSPLRRCRL